MPVDLGYIFADDLGRSCRCPAVNSSFHINPKTSPILLNSASPTTLTQDSGPNSQHEAFVINSPVARSPGYGGGRGRQASGRPQRDHLPQRLPAQERQPYPVVRDRLVQGRQTQFPERPGARRPDQGVHRTRQVGSQGCGEPSSAPFFHGSFAF